VSAMVAGIDSLPGEMSDDGREKCLSSVVRAVARENIGRRVEWKSGSELLTLKLVIDKREASSWTMV
jgi:hypothetical protein